MDDTIDYQGVIYQLQLENESLRTNLRKFAGVQETVYKVPRFLEHLWQKAMINKYQLMTVIMVVYWLASVVFMIWDRFTE